MTQQQKIQWTRENKQYIESMVGSTDQEQVKQLLKLLNPYMLAYQEQNNRWWFAKDERALYYQLFVRHSIINYDDFLNGLARIVGKTFDPKRLRRDMAYAGQVANTVKTYYERKYRKQLAPPVNIKKMSQQEIDDMNKLVDGLSR